MDMKGIGLLLSTYILSALTFVFENYTEIVSATCAVIITVFTAIHYHKSGKLKDAERRKIEIETNQIEEEKREKRGWFGLKK